MGLLLQPDSNTDEEDMDIIVDMYQRDAINFKADFIYLGTTSEPVEDLVDEINGL